MLVLHHHGHYGFKMCHLDALFQILPGLLVEQLNGREVLTNTWSWLTARTLNRTKPLVWIMWRCFKVFHGLSKPFSNLLCCSSLYMVSSCWVGLTELTNDITFRALKSKGVKERCLLRGNNTQQFEREKTGFWKTSLQMQHLHFSLHIKSSQGLLAVFSPAWWGWINILVVECEISLLYHLCEIVRARTSLSADFHPQTHRVSSCSTHSAGECPRGGVTWVPPRGLGPDSVTTVMPMLMYYDVKMCIS